MCSVCYCCCSLTVLLLFLLSLRCLPLSTLQRSHNVHHIVCNSVNYDPDVQHVPVFAVSSSFFKSHYSFYHFRQMTFDALAQVLVSYQHLTFYPIMAVARINLYIQSLLLLFSSRPLDKRPLEAVTLLAFVSWYTLLLTRLPR